MAEKLRALVWKKKKQMKRNGIRMMVGSIVQLQQLENSLRMFGWCEVRTANVHTAW